MNTKTKRCVHCQTNKATSDFGKDNGSSDKLRSWCKDCNRTYQREWVRTRRAESIIFVERSRTASRNYQRRLLADSSNRIIKKQKRLEAYRARRAAYYRSVRDMPSYRMKKRINEIRRRALKLGNNGNSLLLINYDDYGWDVRHGAGAGLSELQENYIVRAATYPSIKQAIKQGWQT